MLGRYRMVRGTRPSSEPLPAGIRQDTRMHTRHVVRPEAAKVRAFLAAPSAAAWVTFAASYQQLLHRRFAQDRAPFDLIAERARTGDVWFGCSCPTAKNPDVARCHTTLALEFFRARYPDLVIRDPRE
ncbi:MAG: hypothetical protein NXI31_21495 [bacterium]|nr:hypothetical protein [bacterium]